MFNAINFYRIANWFHRHGIPIIPTIMRRLMFLIFNSDILPSCQIGKDSRFLHGGIGVVLHQHCQIGERVIIGQNVTVGGSFGQSSAVIGNDVWIGPGVRILGELTIGNNVILGANAVVTTDIPDNSIAMGIPARVKRTISPGALDTLDASLTL